MSKIYYSASTKGFYDTALKGYALPDDAKEVSKEWRAECLLKEKEGKVIVADANGLPVAVVPDPVPPPQENLVTSSALGSAHKYPYTLDKLVLLSFFAASSNGGKITCIDANNVRADVMHNKQQVLSVIEALATQLNL